MITHVSSQLCPENVKENTTNQGMDEHDLFGLL